MAGGLTADKPVDDMARAAFAAVRDAFDAQLGTRGAQADVIAYRTQGV